MDARWYETQTVKRGVDGKLREVRGGFYVRGPRPVPCGYWQMGALLRSGSLLLLEVYEDPGHPNAAADCSIEGALSITPSHRWSLDNLVDRLVDGFSWIPVNASASHIVTV